MTDKTTDYWLNDPAFIKLCDAVAKNNLLCLTGAGISKGLKLRKDAVAPDWNELLCKLKYEMTDELSADEAEDLEILLSNKPSGEELVEASSILCSKNEETFLEVLAESVDLQEGETSEVHCKLLELAPKGILTYNYDVAHENAISKSLKEQWKIILPSDESKVVSALKDNLHNPFLLKMHGTVSDKKTMVLTRETYRDLFVKYPYYKAFVQNLLTNCQLLIVGFGLSDPDFESLLQNVFTTFGSPIQEHIVIKHKKDKSKKDVICRRRYGLNFLYVDDFKDIPKVLSDCISVPGDTINAILNDCVSTDVTIRSKAHAAVRALSTVGKKCLAKILEEIIEKNISNEAHNSCQQNAITSEYVYTYGVIAVSTKEKQYKEFLVESVINKSCYSETLAHALYQIRDVVEQSDKSRVEEWMVRFKNYGKRDISSNPEPYLRVYKYCETMYHLLEAKYDYNDSDKPKSQEQTEDYCTV